MSAAKIVLDTNIVSYLMRGGSLAEAYAPHVQGKLLAISFITVGKMYFGAEIEGYQEEIRNYELEITKCREKIAKAVNKVWDGDEN